MADTEAVKKENETAQNENGALNTEAAPPAEVKQEVKKELGPPSSLEKRIIKQIEYYFGDANLPRDRFLQDAMKEEDGWVSLATMTKFNRLKSLTTNHKIISTALRKASSGLIQVSKDNIFIRRNPEFPIPENTEERRNDFNARTAYAKGFPINASLDKIIAYFEKTSPVDTIFMRRDQNQKFKGSVFVTFKEKSDCDKFLAEAEVKYDETVLLKKPKTSYLSEKAEEKKQRKIEQLRRKKEEQFKRAEEEKERLKSSITLGAILHLTGITGEEISREDFKTYFGDYATVAWVDFEKGDSQAWLRFEEGKAQEAKDKALEAHEGKIEILNCVLEGRVLEGDEELDHWRRIFRDRKDRQMEIKQQRGRKRKFGHKSRGGSKGKKSRGDGSEGDGGDNDDDEDDDGDDDGDDGDDAEETEMGQGDTNE